MGEVLRQQANLKPKGKEKLMKWLMKIKNNLKLMTKEDKTENYPQNQKKYKFKPAPHSGRKKMLENML